MAATPVTRVIVNEVLIPDVTNYNIKNIESETVVIFREVLPNGQPNWDKQFYRMKNGEYISNLNSIGMNDAISAIIIGPRFGVTVFEHADKGGRNVVFNGYNQGLVDFNTLKKFGFDRNISSLYVFERVDEATWRNNCCRNTETLYTSAVKCGNYWSQNPGECGTLGCTGDLLKTDSVCQNWCKKFPQQCDVIKSQFCATHSSDPYCGCINDPPEAIAERKKYPTITINRKCWPSSPCNSGTDLVNTFITTELQPNDGCPDTVKTQINSINAYNSTVNATQGQDMKDGGGAGGPALQSNVIAGNNSIINANQYQDIDNGQPNNAKSRVSWLVFFVIFLILIIICAVIYVVFASD